jgi:hypothetical protein
VHVVAESNNDAAQLKLTSHLEADVPASEPGVSDLGRHGQELWSAQPYNSCAQVSVRTISLVSNADMMSMPTNTSISSYEVIGIFHQSRWLALVLQYIYASHDNISIWER